MISKCKQCKHHLELEYALLSIRGRMNPQKLKEMIDTHRAEGRLPFFVNCTAGTTVMGAFDPIQEIADICQENNIWMHVDVSLVLNFIES